MNSEEIDAFLRSQRRAVIVANGPDGRSGGAVGALAVAEDAVGFALASGDLVIEMLAGDDRACCVVEQYPSYYEIQGVMLHGRVRIVTRDPSVTWFELAVEHVVSFDFAKLRTP